MKHKYLQLLSFAILLLIATVSDANNRKAELILKPTRVILEGKDRYATLSLKNTGDATGQYTIEVIDMKMNEEGTIVPVEKGDYSAKKMVRVSPRSVTIKPGQIQNVRVLVRKPRKLEDGEYRSHIKVRLFNGNILNSDSPIKVKANLVLIIPLIIRHGETNLELDISDAKLIKSKGKDFDNQVSLYLNKTGNVSSMGDFQVIQKIGSKEKVIAEHKGVPVYRETPKRKVMIPIKNNKGTNLSAGEIIVRYNKQEKEGGGVITSSKVKK